MGFSHGDYVCVRSFGVGRFWGFYSGNFNGVYFISEPRREDVGGEPLSAEFLIENGPSGLRLAAPLKFLSVVQVVSIHVVPPEKVAAFRDHPVA